MPTLLDANLAKTLQLDRRRLAQTQFPIITVSASFREDLKHWYGLPDSDVSQDIVFSRAHFSMALGVANHIWSTRMQPENAWLADPTNYVSDRQWHTVWLTEKIGQTLAREPLLKQLKDFLDRFGRSKLPILGSISNPLLFLIELINQPILSFHIAAGNIMAEQGKRVIQVVTDPHVRPEYVQNAALPNTSYCVFDDRTKLEFLEVAMLHGLEIDSGKIHVTGPPIDPRIVAARQHKTAWRSGPLKLCITTGGLGTNSYEIRQVLLQLLPELRKQPSPYQLLVYAGTHIDIAKMVQQLAREEHVAIGALTDTRAKLRLISHPQIFNANELLIKHGFPWADGFITKPSGDMAYDAVAAGCFLLTLKEWGVWEERVREIFEQKDIAHRAEPAQMLKQLQLLQDSISGQSWVERAMNHAFGIEKIFLNGSKNIVEVAKKIAEKKLL